MMGVRGLGGVGHDEKLLRHVRGRRTPAKSRKENRPKKGVKCMDVKDVRIEVVKAMLDEFPELRRWVAAYLKVYG